MEYTFKNSSIVSVNSGTIVLNVSGKTRTFVDAKLVSAVDGAIVLDLLRPVLTEGAYLTVHLTYGSTDKHRTFIVNLNDTDAISVHYHVSQCSTGIKYANSWLRCTIYRNATPEEIQELNDQLAAEGKCWNPDTMQIEKLRWKPITGQIYYYVGLADIPYVSFHIWKNDIVDNSHYQSKNCFRTEEEAIVVMEKVKKLLLEV